MIQKRVAVMFNQALFHGIILAFGLILPLGVQNIFIFNQGVVQDRWIRVLPVVITAALCDTFLILLAVLGVSAIVLTFTWVKFALVAAGVLFLFYMGWITWNTQTISSKSSNNDGNWTIRRQLIFAITVSLLNPHAIIDTIGVIGTTSLTFQSNDRILFTIGTIVTSWVWFLVLSFLGRLVGITDRTGTLSQIINKFSALIMWGSAIYLIYSLIA